MLNREQYVESILEEGRILKHLHSKVPANKLDFRPTPEQRSLAELLAYLPINAGPLVEGIVTGNFKAVMEGAERIMADARKDFPGTIDRETRRVADLLKDIPETDFLTRDVQMMSGVKMKLGAALVNYPLKFLSAYRMQLFLYLKSCGKTELKSSNLWKGADPPPGGLKGHG